LGFYFSVVLEYIAISMVVQNANLSEALRTNASRMPCHTVSNEAACHAPENCTTENPTEMDNFRRDVQIPRKILTLHL